MAGDWIKMRTDLQTHPKIVRILSATRADKFRVVGGLHAVWAIFDTHSEDGVLKGYTPELLDHVIGWEGFARAMESVGWLTYDGLETLALPEFDAHNGQSAKRRAEDQKRKRNERKSSVACPQSVHNESGQIADKKRTREEKRREENKKTAPEGDLLAGVSGQVADDFRALRSRLRAPITKTAMAGIEREATKAGISLEAALAMCCERSWRGFKAEWVEPAGKAKAPAGYQPLPGEI